MAKVTILCTLLILSPILSLAEEDSSWRFVNRLISDCESQDDMTLCFKAKAANFLDRLIRTPHSIQVTDFLSLAKDPSVKVEETSQESPLPRNLNERSEKLDEMLWGKLVTLFKTKSLQFNLPENAFEGRKDELSKLGKKGGGYIWVAVMFYATMMKMGLAGIAALAGKALLIAKVALTLAAVVALKKLSHGGGGESHPQVVYATAEHSGGGGGGGWSRRFNVEGNDGQNLAYNAHI